MTPLLKMRHMSKHYNLMAKLKLQMLPSQFLSNQQPKRVITAFNLNKILTIWTNKTPLISTIVLVPWRYQLETSSHTQMKEVIHLLNFAANHNFNIIQKLKINILTILINRARMIGSKIYRKSRIILASLKSTQVLQQ